MSKRAQKDFIDQLHDYSLYIPTRTIYIGSESSSDVGIDSGESGVDHILAERFIKNMHLLESISKEPITIILNNPGGDWYHGIAIYDAIKSSECYVTIIVYGHAMSMGSVILQAADKRIMAPNARLMIHYGYMGMSSNHSKIFDKWSEENKRINKEMESIYLEKMQAKNPHVTLPRLRRMLDFDTILSAAQTVKCGLADEVLSSESRS